MFDTMVRPGSILLGKYRVERKLGQGGMGVVLAARHVELGELFAIKLLVPSGAEETTAAGRFIREARAAARLTSEHVARVYDVGRLDGGTPYLVMEYLAGDNLGKVLADRGSLPLKEAALLVAQACDALAEAHAIGIVHRDLKPSNLFLTRRRNGAPCLKVIDFGISKQADSSDPLTKPGAIVGSPFCMSPEQILDPKSVDGRSDIWAMGVVLYQLTTGRLPFHGENLPNQIQSVLSAEVAPPSSLRPDLPPALDEVISRCLRRSPAERYVSAEEFAAAVRRLANLPEEPRSFTTLLTPSSPLHLHEPTVTMLPDAPEQGAAPADTYKVFISCRGDVEEDLEVAMSFYEVLSAAGASPFLASKSVTGQGRWIGDVSQALRSCDAFLLLLSRQAAVSELVAAEFDMAWQLRQSHAGRPYLLPVRVHFPESDAQGHPLQERLHELEQLAWSGPRDTPVIVAKLLEQIGHRARSQAPLDAFTALPPQPPSPPSAGVPLELPGGVVSAKSPFYVSRPSVEESCRRAVVRPGALIRIKGPRQVGKTSLMVQIAEHAAQAGARTVTINLQLADGAILADPNRLLRWLCAVATRRLKLPLQRIDEQWDDIFGAKDNCTAYFEEHLLAEGDFLVLMLDHVDRVFESPATAEEFLALLRAWHEMGKSQSPWHKLRLVLAYSTEMYLPLQLNHSPFNVGLPVALAEWDAEMVRELAQRHGLSWSRAEIEQVMGLLGGHPHLIRLALYHVASGTSLKQVLTTAATDEGLFADHLKYLLWQVQSRPELREAAARVMAATEPVELNTELAFKLVSLGLVHLQGNAVLPARNLYRLYFPARLSTH